MAKRFPIKRVFLSENVCPISINLSENVCASTGKFQNLWQGPFCSPVAYEPRHEKICLRGLWPG